MQDNATKEIAKTKSFEELRSQLDQSSGETYWRSFEELSDTKEFQEVIQNEFPQEPSLWNGTTTRRSFLQLMGSMIAMAGLAGCTRQPTEKIVPYVKAPEEIVPGKPLYFATAIAMAGYARGILVESHMGRPTKIEGNPEHPDSLGAADVQTQASVLSLYDPDRSRAVTQTGNIRTWEAFISAMGSRMEAQKLKNGSGLRILTETVISPTAYGQLMEILKKYPEAKWHQYSPINRDNSRQGAIEIMNDREDVVAHYDIEKSNVILSLDSDFLNDGPGSLRYARQFARRRKVKDGKTSDMNRLYAIESTPTLTGSMADHRLPMRSNNVLRFIILLGRTLGMQWSTGTLYPSGEETKWIEALAKDLVRNRGRSVVIPGESQPPAVHSLCHAINSFLTNTGQTVFYTEPVELKSENQLDSLRELVSDLNAGLVDDLIILGSNPVYKTPVDLNFKDAMQKARFKVHLGMYANETSGQSHWHIPQAHYLEAWSDARAFDGTSSVIQPLIHPLYNGKSIHEVLSVLQGKTGLSGYDLVKDYWKEKQVVFDDKGWEKILHDGVIPNSSSSKRSVSIRSLSSIATSNSAQEDKLIELIIRKDPNIGDGDWVNNGWLQELPKPLTRVAWDNAVHMSPKTADGLGLKSEDEVELTLSNNSVKGAVWVMPGHAENSVTIHLGYGQKDAGKVGSGIGFNAYQLLQSQNSYVALGLQIKKTGNRYKLASTQDHHAMENRHLVRSANLDHYLHEPDFAQHMVHDPKPTETLYKPEEHLKADHQWAMSIDLNACIGCNACTVACQSENNIPIVGKEEVANGREMHWIRVDRYYKGNLDAPEIYHQPVPCMHCENAPCEPVCPVGATVHSDEGLNEMTYNRCVGTRYCANNCSYKVRRFNFYKYADHDTPSLKLGRNPDVTVRSRGVMEKCTYCVQRINSARIEAKKEGRLIRDGEVVTACQQTCPTEAIQFGNIKDKNSQISKDKASPLNYALLTDLGTRPRTSYLARIKNPNPDLVEAFVPKKHAVGH